MPAPDPTATPSVVVIAALAGLALGPLLRRLALLRPEAEDAPGRGCSETRSHAPSGLACALLCAVVCASLALRLGLSLQGLEALGVAGALTVAALADLDRHLIPNRAVLAACLIRLACLVAGDLMAGKPPLPHMAASLMAGLAAGLPALLLALAMGRATGRVGLGGGDVKLLFALGLCLGLVQTLLVVLVACALGVAYGLVRAGLSRGRLNDPFAFGPALALACWAVELVQPQVAGLPLTLP